MYREWHKEEAEKAQVLCIQADELIEELRVRYYVSWGDVKGGDISGPEKCELYQQLYETMRQVRVIYGLPRPKRSYGGQ